MTINELTKQLVRKRADYLCEYCHSPEKISTSRFTIDRIQPRSLGDSDNSDNLALACSRCNQRRYNFIVGRDVETSAVLPLFNPRQQSWPDHFIWNADGIKIVGITPIGRATCERLDLNHERYRGERSIQEARALWVQAGWHPPLEDPRQLE
ncbi:HNH endonuclease [Phormidium sp. LEGE 05292]|uniref:HNH endonuclease n=1 Tax=[Phormidium] sp. LEGE 05292 TaxID=767427 RepID=UPI0018802F01|nr:HNH endonuclease signature motif containing protein [Phormidium sp. LEGE 05292]MBE9228868.1 HNH endonuclease [Phormidium sp. LEGE 05292]